MTTSSIVLIAGIASLVAILGSLLFTRRMVVLLTGKYLLKRKLAWVSLIATFLCVAMVLVVLSVMSGWLAMFKQSFKNLSGDVIVSRSSMKGFAGYEEIIRRGEALPEVEAGVPMIRTAALLSMRNGWSNYVGVVGVPIEKIDRVMGFRKALWLQSGREVEKSADGLVPRPPREPSFALWPDIDYQANSRDPQAFRRPGLIIGSGVIAVHKDKATKQLDWPSFMLGDWAKLTIVPSSEDPNAGASTINARTTPYFIVDGIHTSTFEHDNNVYVPFEQLQQDLGLAEVTYEAEEPLDPKNPHGPTKKIPVTEPARTTEIQFKLRPGADLDAAKEKIRSIVDEVTGQTDPIFASVKVMTWEQQQERFLNAVENEIRIMMTLFGLISLVAVFMIFCIFYTIVAEKTRDIGILKSVGASEWHVAQIFLTYGAAIGFVGGAIGVLAGWQFVKWINEIQDLITRITGQQIYNSDVYQMEKLPDTIDWTAALVIWVLAVAAAILGALVPAIVAALKRPVESLRFE